MSINPPSKLHNPRQNISMYLTKSMKIHNPNPNLNLGSIKIQNPGGGICGFWERNDRIKPPPWNPTRCKIVGNDENRKDICFFLNWQFAKNNVRRWNIQKGDRCYRKKQVLCAASWGNNKRRVTMIGYY